MNSVNTMEEPKIDEEVLGAALSGYPANNVEAGNIDSSKMIEGLDPRKATITECQRAFVVLQNHGILTLGERGNPKRFSIYNSGDDVHVQYMKETKHPFDYTTLEDVAFDLGKIAAAIPNARFDRYSERDRMGGARGASVLKINSISELAIAINTLAKSYGSKALDEITMIQDYEHNNFKGS